MHFSLLQPRGQSFRLTESLFLRLLGLIYLIAFASLWPQMVGLVGQNGISPASEILGAMHADYGWHAYLYVPSLFWLHSTDGALNALCGLGCLTALALIAGFAARTAALAAYLFYLSLVTIGQPFTSFQWDSLLLETGFLAIFTGSSFLPFAYRFLLFRLMFESGLVKLVSGDINWRNGHALRYHFWTQPLPNPIAYYVAHFPNWLLDSFTYATVATELIVPFFLFAFPRRIRHWCAGILVFLQAAIAITGNYAFFNLLSAALCLWALDDSSMPVWIRKLVRRSESTGLRFRHPLDLAVLALLALSVLQQFELEPSFLSPFEAVNSYGLFAVMTTSRTELVVEGSNDNIHWEPYSFLYKPGDLRRTLPLVAPYQPRLDWQMWFAALGTPESNLWVKSFVYRLLAGEPKVLKLLQSSPFRTPPRSIRIVSYTYEFSTGAKRTRDGAIWQRQLLGVWLGPLSLEPEK